MRSWKRRTAVYLAVLVGSMLAFAVVYWWGMAALEGRERRFVEALQVVVETYTTTGYGSDAGWETTAMNLFVIVMDLTGMAILFLALPTFVLPAVRDALESAVPAAADPDLTDHVVIASHSDRVDPLRAELAAWDVEYVLLEPDRSIARDLYERGIDVVHAAPDEVEGLEAANAGSARALVVDVDDQMDASIVLTARELDEDLRVVSVVEEPDRARYHELAGADAVVSPRPLLGERLASTVTSTVATDLDDVVDVGEDFHVVELPVPRDSDLVGRTIAESGLREGAGVTVIGAWFRGAFETPPPPDAEIEAGSVLLVTGDDDAIERLASRSAGTPRPHARGDTVVVGHGEVGRAITGALAAADVSYTVLDRRDDADVDVVGDATDPAAHRRAGVADASSVVLAIPDDGETEFATLIARDLSEDVTVAARAEETETVPKLYRAGADYVLSLDTVTGRLLASTVLEEEDVLSSDTRVEVVRVDAGSLAGRTLAEARIPDHTGCTVVAIERDGAVLTDLDPEFRIEAGDDLIVAGTDEGTNRFTERYE